MHRTCAPWRQSGAAALALGLIVCAAPPQGLAIAEADTDPEQAAAKAAEAWLTTVDGGGYGESWDGAAALLREQVPRETWIGQVSAVRDPLGEVTKRELRQAQHVTSLPGAPPGQYVVMQFETDFEQREGATETVTAMAEGEDWKIAGYYVK